MKIFADENILELKAKFSRYGELHLFDGRTVEQADLIEADALLVRSITSVNESLLNSTNVRFVGTATSGVDHIDTDYLKEAGIKFTDAKGSNANAVVDYFFSALAYASLEKGFCFSDSKVGIVGAGAVGGLLASKLESLGVEVRCCDPFLAGQESREVKYFSLEEVLACDVVSLHVPLTNSGPYPTVGMVGPDQLALLGENAVLVNACRGRVVDEAALKRLLEQRDDIVTVFDVWSGEPAIDSELALSVDIATPHIAGYSREAKIKATEILAQALESHFDLVGQPNNEITVDDREANEILFDSSISSPWESILSVFPLDGLSNKFKQALNNGSGAMAFDSLRRELVHRREFECHTLQGQSYSSEDQKLLCAIGFVIE